MKPFVLKIIDQRSLTYCATCPWQKKCFGCAIEPSDKIIPDFPAKVFIAIDWDKELIENDYNESANEKTQHPSYDQVRIDEKKESMTLDDCFKKFTENEELTEKDNVHCSKCRNFTPHVKTLQIMRTPPVLIVQLKRFMFTSTTR